MCEVTILFPIEITWPHAKKNDLSADAAQAACSIKGPIGILLVGLF
jgi:hypothetical protein